MRVVRLAFAILNLSIAAKYFGVSIDRDIWLLALNAIIILDVALWAPLNDTFRAKFLFIKEEKGITVALSNAKSLLLLTNVITIAIVALIMFFPEALARLLAPSYKAEHLASLKFMIRLLAPTFLLNQVSKILTSILNTFQSFIIPEVAGLLSQVFTLLVIVLLAPKMGIISLAFSYYAGLFLLLLLLIFQLKKLKINIFQAFFKTGLKDALSFFAFSLPFFIPHFIAQLNLIIEKSLASSSETGAVSILDYARKFTDIPLDVLIGILVTMLVPVLSASFSDKLKKGFLEEFVKIYQFGLLIIVLIVAIFTGCSGAIIDFLYKEGNISEIYLKQISLITMFYSWSAFGVFLYHIYGLSLLSAKKGKLFAFYGSLAQLLMIALNLYFFKSYSVYIFPFSLGISHFIAAIIMATYFPIKNHKLFVISLKYGSLIVGMALLIRGINLYLIHVQSAFITIALNIILISVILVAVIFIAKFDERLIVKQYWRKLFA